MSDAISRERLRDLVARFPSDLLGENLTFVATDAEIGLDEVRADVLLEDPKAVRHAVFVTRVLSRSLSGRLAGIRRSLDSVGSPTRVRVVSLEVPAERRDFLKRVGIDWLEIRPARLQQLTSGPAEDERPAPSTAPSPTTAHSQDLGPGAYPSSELSSLSRAFEQLTHKIWDLRTGENSWGTDDTPLIDFLYDCGHEVSELRERGVLSHEVDDLRVADWLSDLSEVDLAALRSFDARGLELSSDLAALQMVVTHRVRANKGSKDPKCTRHLDRSLEDVIGSALCALREGIPFLPRPGAPGEATVED